MKKSRLLGLFLAMVLIVSCVSIASADEKVHINLWHQWTIDTDSNRIALDKAVAEYVAANPNIEIESHILENEAYKTKMSTEFAGSASSIDVFFYWGGGRAGKLQQADKLLPLQDYLTAEQMGSVKPGSANEFT